MYKVFVDNIPIYFQKDSSFASNISTDFFPSVPISKYNSFLEELNRINVKDKVWIKSSAPLEQIKTLFTDFKWIEAAGGIVKNTHTKQLLFIFRRGLWDIPKGKIEKTESPKIAAIREIEEECGISNLAITGELSPTYHVYFAYGKHFIKKTHWYKLATKEVNVKPQFDEDITEAKWFYEHELQTVKNNTFTSIVDVLQEFSKKAK